VSHCWLCGKEAPPDELEGPVRVRLCSSCIKHALGYSLPFNPGARCAACDRPFRIARRFVVRPKRLAVLRNQAGQQLCAGCLNLMKDLVMSRERQRRSA